MLISFIFSPNFLIQANISLQNIISKHSFLLRVSFFSREYWMLYRGPCGEHRKSEKERQFADGRSGGRGWNSQFVPRRESLVLHKSFNTLSFTIHVPIIIFFTTQYWRHNYKVTFEYNNFVLWFLPLHYWKNYLFTKIVLWTYYPYQRKQRC
jgi:hypothetical protein